VDGPGHTDRSAWSGGDGPPPAAGGPGRRALLLGLARALGTSLGVLVLYFVLPLDRGFSLGTVLALGAGVLATGVLLAWQVRTILRARHPALRAVEAVALSLPLFLLMFAAAYAVLSGTEPAAFTEPLSRIDSLYFVITVFATVGFGDITAVSELARVLVGVQMVGDLLLIGLVLRVFLIAVNRGRRAAVERGAAAPSPRSGREYSPQGEDGRHPAPEAGARPTPAQEEP
jgi:voltage-gated potassium channel